MIDRLNEMIKKYRKLHKRFHTEAKLCCDEIINDLEELKKVEEKRNENNM